MKKLLSIIISIMLIIGLTACGSTSGKGDSGDSGKSTGKGEVVKIICPYGVGGTADLIARKYAKVAGRLYPDYQFVVEQKTGGDGFVGAAYFQNLDKDTKELLVYGYGNCYRHDIGKKYETEDVPWDRDKILPIATVDDRTWILYAKPGTTLEQVIEKAKAGELKMSGGNPLSDPHLALGSLLSLEDGKVTVVAYDGGAAQKQGLLNGEVDVFMGTTQAAMEEVEAGTIDPILAFSEEGYDGFKGKDGKQIKVPGVGENKAEGLDPSKDYTASILPAGGYLAGRVGADQAWVDKVIEISKAVWNDPEYSDWIKEIGLNRYEVYGDEAVKHLDDAIERAINAYDMLSKMGN